MSRWSGPAFLFSAFTLAGTSVVSARFVSDKLGTFTITAAGLFFALLLLLPLGGKRLIKDLKALTARGFWLIVLQAVFGIFLFRMFLIFGLRRTSAVEAGILTGATPAITAILAVLLLKEAPNTQKISGILCAVAGVFLINGLANGAGDFSALHLLGNLLVLCAAASESAFNILSRVTAAGNANENKLDPKVQTAAVAMIALILCVIPALFESPVRRLGEIGAREWLALIWYGLFGTALAFICWYAGIKRCKAFTAAAFSGMMPLTAMLLSIAILQEQVGWQQWSGCLLVIAGIVLIGFESAREKGVVMPQNT